MLSSRRYLIQLLLDYGDKGALRSNQGTSRGARLSEVLGLIIGVAIPLFSILNSLTSALLDLATFRVRAIVAILSGAILTVACASVVVKKARVWSLDHGAEVLTYRHGQAERILGKLLLPVALLASVLGVGELRYFYGSAISFSGSLHDNGMPVADATLDFLDRDHTSLCIRCVPTDAEGEFFARLRSGGRVVSMKVEDVAGATKCVLGGQALGGIYEEQSDLILHRDCSE